MSKKNSYTNIIIRSNLEFWNFNFQKICPLDNGERFIAKRKFMLSNEWIIYPMICCFNAKIICHVPKATLSQKVIF